MIAFAFGLVVSFVLTGLVVPLLARAGVLDRPNVRSSHREVVPRGGGVGLLLGLGVGVMAAVSLRHPSTGEAEQIGAVVLASLLVAGVGLVDDVWTLSYGIRLGCQTVVAVALVVRLGVGARGDAFGVALVVMVTLWLVAYVNAFNFMDGINGISGLSAAVAGGWYGWLGFQHHQGALVVLGLGLAGASVGFLPWNAPVARVFLGDVGSYGIGFLLGGLALLAILTPATLQAALAPLVVYLADTAWALGGRLYRHEDVRAAHRQHVYQRLLDSGWTHLTVAVTVAGLALLICVFVQVLAWPLSLILTLVLLTGYLGLPHLIARERKVAS